MNPDLRHTLDTAYESLENTWTLRRRRSRATTRCALASSWGRDLRGMSKEEAAVERAHLSMLATMYEIKLGVRSGFGR